MTGLHITLLGSYHISLDNRPVNHLATKKVQALLAYLAVEGREPKTRSYLAALLWPSKPDSAARKNLRQTLFRLRGAVPDPTPQAPFFNTTRRTIQLNPEGGIWVDVTAFEQLLQLCRNHQHPELESCLPCIERLEKAVALYQGDFLNQFYVADCNEFERWAQATRERLKRGVLETLMILTNYFSLHGEYDLARRYAQQQIDIEPLSEEGYRQIMHVLALHGRSEAAVAQYQLCRQRLFDELKVTPDQHTDRLYRQILAKRVEDPPTLSGLNRMYDRQEEIGRGLFSVVYRAIHPLMKREVAVKVIQPDYADNPDFIRSFEREAQAISGLDHPHIVRYYDYWREPHHAYLVMRYLPGGNLQQSLSKEHWSIAAIGRLLDQITSALTAAHEKGIIHRDIKSDNILLDREGNAYLADFGIARDWLLSAYAPGDTFATSSLLYISPEQIRELPATPRSDQYSLAMVLYEMLTRRPLFAGLSTQEILDRHIHHPLPDLEDLRPNLPAGLNEMIQRATAKDPADRFPSVEALAVAFHQAVDHSTMDNENHVYV